MRRSLDSPDHLHEAITAAYHAVATEAVAMVGPLVEVEAVAVEDVKSTFLTFVPILPIVRNKYLLIETLTTLILAPLQRWLARSEGFVPPSW